MNPSCYCCCCYVNVAAFVVAVNIIVIIVMVDIVAFAVVINLLRPYVISHCKEAAWLLARWR